jgi:hypothetical protein
MLEMKLRAKIRSLETENSILNEELSDVLGEFSSRIGQLEDQLRRNPGCACRENG